MASKSDILKRIGASKKGKPTWQDENRLKTWKDAGQGSILQKEGYNRAVRNMQKAAQQGRAFNEVDTQIFSAYVKETPEQLLSKSKTFMNLATWLPVGGLAAKGVQLGVKALGKLAAPKVVKKAAAPKVVKKAAAPVVGGAKEGVRKIVRKISGRTAAEATAKKALKAAQRKAQRARISARTKVLGDIAKGGMHTKGLARKADRAGRTAYNKIMKQHGKAAKATTAVRQAKNLRRGQIAAGGAALAAVPAVVALTGDEKNEKKVPIPKAKPTGSEVFWERAKRAKAARAKAAEQKAITRSRAGRDTGIGAGRAKAAEVATAPPKNLLKQDEPELRPWEGGVRYADLPEWLGGGRIKIDSSDETMNTSYPGEEYKKGGRIKKSVKKAKAKPRKAKAKTRKVAQKPRGVGVARKGYGKAMYV